MQFALIFNETRAELARAQTDAATYRGAWDAYIGAMVAADVMRGGTELQPPDTGTTLRIANGEWQVEDGPFADTKELLGGFVVLEVTDLDAALAWAARAPCAAAGSVEVRPIVPSPQA
jgi:hypothetical protein